MHQNLKHSAPVSECDMTVFGNVTKINLEFEFPNILIEANIVLAFLQPLDELLKLLGHLVMILGVLNFIQEL